MVPEDLDRDATVPSNSQKSEMTFWESVFPALTLEGIHLPLCPRARADS
jgi:hypothetical protein